MKPRIFLTAEWRHLVLLNYEIDPAVLEPYLPQGLELDFWNDRTYVSVVGFAFQRACFFGLPVPFHRSFPEVNLRFYVKRELAASERRGVVFLKEIVPRRAVAFVARTLYGEKFVALPMRMSAEADRTVRRVRYDWRQGREHYAVEAASNSPPRNSEPGSLDEFIIEHYWAYSGGECCTEYEVEHPPWLIQDAQEGNFIGDATALYGEEFAEVLARPPDSAFLAHGSAVSVRRGSLSRVLPTPDRDITCVQRSVS